MSVKSQHPEYKRLRPIWDKCRAASIGQRAIHDGGATYLPRLSGQSEEEYQSYKMRTPFFNATWRTIDGLRGMVFRKPMEIKAPERIRPMLDDISLDGRNLHMFAMDVMQDVLEVGRVGLFTDYPLASAGLTMADATAMKLRPIVRNYKAEACINWKMKARNGTSVLSMVVLHELAVVGGDEFEEELEDRYRVLDLIEDPATGVAMYRVRVFKVVKEKGQERDVLVEGPYFPMVRGNHIDYIPFQFVGTDSVSCHADEPPLVDLVDINLSHYRVTADYEHGCHFTGLPTPYIAGYRAEAEGEGGEKETFNIGSTTAWVFHNAQAKVGFLEFTGTGLGALEKNLARKENQMAVLGARMLEAQRSTTESANTATIRQGGEQSMLASITSTVSIGLTNVAKWFASFADAEPSEMQIALNKDFFPFPMDSLMMTAYVAAWQNQAISYDTMYDMLKRAEVVPQDRKADEEQKMIKDNPPALPPGTKGMDGAAEPNLQTGGKADNPTQKELQ